MANLQKTQGSASSRTKAVTARPPETAEAPTAERIAARAYEIWQANGCPEGRDAEYWYQAERELRARAGN
ncbi:MAG TPA: DUF2934 domain-containing protein [Anaeromyxobacteraceae bacterium]|nr:DUF2934 domain-containing protein [Anaeromyxobacteraceae bacterium]